MAQLKNALCLYASRTLLHSPHLRVIVSGTDREGEGEYKIFEYLHHLTQHEAELMKQDPSAQKKCLVVGKYVFASSFCRPLLGIELCH